MYLNSEQYWFPSELDGELFGDRLLLPAKQPIDRIVKQDCRQWLITAKVQGGKFYTWADIGSVIFDSTGRTAAGTCSACGGECFPKSFKDGTSGSQCQVCGSTFGGDR